MEKTVLKTFICMYIITAVCSDYSAFAQDNKGPIRSVMIANGDTLVNGKKLNDLRKTERDKLRREFKDMEKKFRSGRGSQDVAISRIEKEPKVLHWNDNIEAPGRMRTFKFNGDSLLGTHFKAFTFDSDSSLNFSINTDSLMKNFNIKVQGLDSNFSKRIITVHPDFLPGRPGGNIWRGDGPGITIERRPLSGFSNRNNSSTFNYNHTDKDGISTYMSIRLSDVDQEQLRRITSAESIIKDLRVNDLTLFPNFSTGKMAVSFNLTSKGTTKISILDRDLNPVFTDDAANFSGNYIKQFTLKNGVYYVTIVQNGNWFVKQLLKE